MHMVYCERPTTIEQEPNQFLVTRQSLPFVRVYPGAIPI